FNLDGTAIYLTMATLFIAPLPGSPGRPMVSGAPSRVFPRLPAPSPGFSCLPWLPVARRRHFADDPDDGRSGPRGMPESRFHPTSIAR
ncbi:hypothetical protein ACWDTT_21135, partial [Streptosporangium sandarakinum]